jgi:hypothetical protein
MWHEGKKSQSSSWTPGEKRGDECREMPHALQNAANEVVRYSQK